jgi:hypothetical protein
MPGSGPVQQNWASKIWGLKFFFWVVCRGCSSKQEVQKTNVSNKKKSSVFLLVARIFLMDFDDID